MGWSNAEGASAIEFIKDDTDEAKLIFMDWLQEHELDPWEAYGSTTTLKPHDFRSFGNADNSSYDGGIGSGYGSGWGFGHGSGRGFGCGSRDDCTDDNLNDLNYHLPQQGVLYMEIDKAYLVHCGDWHAFVGRVIKMISPVVYLMKNVSKIKNVNNFDNLANNVDRDKVTYLHYEGIVTIPLIFAAFEWVGQTPKESL